MRRAILYRILLALGSTAFALIAAEVLLRVMVAQAPSLVFSEYDDRFWELMFLQPRGDEDFSAGGMHVVHPTRGWAPAPNRHIFLDDRHYTTNDRGQRATGPFVPTPGKYVVLVGGDSYTFGIHANDADVWPAVLQTLDDRLQVVNAAAAGYGVDQIAISLEESIPEYRPQLAILAYIHDDLRRAQLGFREYRKPRFVLEGDTLRLTNTPIGPLAETRDELHRKYALPHPMTWELLRSRFCDRAPDTDDTFRLNELIVASALAAAERSSCDFLLLHLACDNEIKDPRLPDLGEQFLQYYGGRHKVTCLETRVKFLEKGTHWDVGHYQRPHAELVARAVYEEIKTLASWQRSLRQTSDAY